MERYQLPVRKFINDHLNADTLKLALKKSPFPDIPMRELLLQIEGKRKAKEKIPSFFQTDDIVYPLSVSMEQCSSEQTSLYKASLCGGNQLVDLTGGFGVDAWMFSKKFDKVVYCEKDENLVNIARHNFSVLHAQNIDIQHGDGMDFLKQQKRTFDWIYIDPSRRDRHNRKMQALSDCTPDVVENLDVLFQYGNRIMLKTSPMLDIDKAVSDLKQVEAIHIVAVKNEVREVLYIMKKNSTVSSCVESQQRRHCEGGSPKQSRGHCGLDPQQRSGLLRYARNDGSMTHCTVLQQLPPSNSPWESSFRLRGYEAGEISRHYVYAHSVECNSPLKMVAVNILPDAIQSFSFSKEELQNAEAVFSMPLAFLYEPNAAVMKSGAFNLVSARFNIFKLHRNSHLYTSDRSLPDFPGRIFKIKETMAYKPVKDLSRANVSVRNFPDTPAEVRKKLKISDGGDVFLFCTTLVNDKPAMLWCEKEPQYIQA